MNGEINLKHFLAKGYVTKRDRILTFVLPFYDIIIANRVFSHLKKQHLKVPATLERTTIAAYQGNNETAKKIQLQIQSAPHEAIVAALVHGSIGDLNEIEYSDFDGIILIDSNKIQLATQLQELRKIIKETELIFFEQDALQHHGWAIFTTADLLQFKDHLFPYDLIRNSKCLFPNNEIVVEAQIHSENDQYQLLLKRLCISILRKTDQFHLLKNQYFLKNLLSEIMLLPSAFLQAKHNKSVNKRDSFSFLKNEFPNIDAQIIDWLSEIRMNWKQDKLTFKTKLFHQLKEAGITLSFLAPQTTPAVLSQLSESRKQQIVKLCETLLKNVG